MSLGCHGAQLATTSQVCRAGGGWPAIPTRLNFSMLDVVTLSPFQSRPWWRFCAKAQNSYSITAQGLCVYWLDWVEYTFVGSNVRHAYASNHYCCHDRLRSYQVRP